MGWSWALWVLQCILTASTIPVLPHGANSLVLDRGAPPLATADSPIVSIYFDNLAVAGLSRESVDGLMLKIIQVLDQLEFGWREHISAATILKLIGILWDGRRGILKHTPERHWRLYYALTEFVRFRFTRKWQCSCVLGHVVFHRMLARPMLSRLSAVYRDL